MSPATPKVYTIDFGFDIGEAKPGQAANMEWGMAEGEATVHGVTNWKPFDHRKSVDPDSALQFRVFNTSDTPSGQQAAIVTGTLLSRKAFDAQGQKNDAPWPGPNVVPIQATGVLPGGQKSHGLNLDDVPGAIAMNTSAPKEGHFAITLNLVVLYAGLGLIFVEDPELVVGGGTGN